MFALTDDNKHVNGAGTKDGAAANEQVNAWTAHKTDTGVVYYYNAVTGESTYEKPYDFKGEVFDIFTSFLVYCLCTLWLFVIILCFYLSKKKKKLYILSKLITLLWLLYSFFDCIL